MNKRQKLVQQQFLDNEEGIIKRLTQVHTQSLKDITAKIEKLQEEFDELTAIYDTVEDEAQREVLKSMQRSKVYQKKYQEGLKKQVGDVLDNLHKKEFKSVSEYLDGCYTDGFIGAMYDLQGQGLPFIFPIDQEAMVRAVQLDSKISQGLYKRLGEDVALLKKKITAQVSRGISTGMSYDQMAKSLSGITNIGFNNAARIARTEGHRIQVQSGMDACYKAKEKGADVVKQWDSTLDSKTRESHKRVDGEIRELDEEFSNGLMFPGDPDGKAEAVIHCRCALLQRARWAAEGGFTKMNNFTKQLESFESPEDYAEFKKTFFSKENRQYMNHVQKMEDKYGTKNFIQVIDGMSDKEYNKYSNLLANNPVFRKKKVDEGVFTTFNATKSDTIRPKSIMNEMRKSQTGTDALEYLVKENVPVRLYYGTSHPKGVCGRYDPFDDEISIFCDETKTTKETALAVIHEATHRKPGGKGTFKEEVECFKAEVMHKKGYLTDSDISDIIEHVKKNYPELL